MYFSGDLLYDMSVPIAGQWI